MAKEQKSNIEYYSKFGRGEWIELRKSKSPQEPANGYFNNYDKFLKIVPKLLFFDKMDELKKGKFPNLNKDITDPWENFQPARIETR